MRLFKIKSPAGKVYKIIADSFYHAIQKAKSIDNYIYTEIQYK
jgi:hypothetical protein